MDYRAIAQSLVELHAALRLGPVARQLSELDCGTFLALQLLSSGDAHPCELSRKMGVSTARVAALVNHLERGGLAVRRPDPDDSRAVTVSLTPAGKARICEKREAAVSALAGGAAGAWAAGGAGVSAHPAQDPFPHDAAWPERIRAVRRKGGHADL